MPEYTIEEIKNLLTKAQAPNKDFAVPFVVVDNDQRVQTLDLFLDKPIRKMASVSFYRPPSFIDYVNEQKQEKTTQLYVVSDTVLRAVIDDHGADVSAANWRAHVATLTLKNSIEYTTWKGKHGIQMVQKDFAQFLEDNSQDIQSPDGITLLNLVRDLKASQNIECTGAINENSDDRSGSYEVVTKTKAGVLGDIELPQQITLQLSVYEGGIALPLVARLKLSVSPPKLWLSYELVRVQQFEKQALQVVTTHIEDKTNIVAFYGDPGVS